MQSQLVLERLLVPIGRHIVERLPMERWQAQRALLRIEAGSSSILKKMKENRSEFVNDLENRYFRLIEFFC